MTSTDLKNVLTSVADTLDQGAKIFPSNLDQELITLLSNLDDTSAKLLASILNMPVENFKKLVPDIINLLNAANGLFTTDEHTKISNFCRALAARPFVLSIISRFI